MPSGSRCTPTGLMVGVRTFVVVNRQPNAQNLLNRDGGQQPMTHQQPPEFQWRNALETCRSSALPSVPHMLASVVKSFFKSSSSLRELFSRDGSLGERSAGGADMGGTVAPHMCVPEIPQVRVTAQAWNDASKYGPYCELFFLLISVSQIRQRRHVSF